MSFRRSWVRVVAALLCCAVVAVVAGLVPKPALAAGSLDGLRTGRQYIVATGDDLVFCRSIEDIDTSDYANGVQHSFVDVSGKGWSGYVFDPEDATQPWRYAQNTRSSVVHVYVADGQCVSIPNMASMFSGIRSLGDADLRGFDLRSNYSLGSMFKDCYGLYWVNLSTKAGVFDLSSMFENCYSLQMVDLSGLEDHGAGDLSRMFANCYALRHVVFGERFDSTSISNMTETFSHCHSLERVDLSKQHLTNLVRCDRMFESCHSLAGVKWPAGRSDLPSHVRSVTDMFSGCDNYNFDVLNMDYWDFSSLEGSGVLRLKPPSNVYHLSAKNSRMGRLVYDFSDTHSLRTVSFDYSTANWVPERWLASANALNYASFRGFSVSSAVSLRSMFEGLGWLYDVDFSHSSFSGVSNMSAMFRNCPRLYHVDFSDSVGMGRAYGVSIAPGMVSMFENCASLSELTMFNGVTNGNYNGYYTTVGDASNMFKGCSKLATLDIACLSARLGEATLTDMFEGTKRLRRVNFRPDFAFGDAHDSGIEPGVWRREEPVDEEVFSTEDIGEQFGSTYFGNLAGWYALSPSTVVDDLSAGVALEYDGVDTIMYGLADEGLWNFGFNVPTLAESGSLDLRAIMSDDEDDEVKRKVLSLWDEEGPESVELDVRLRGRAAVDIVGCSKADKVIWTFDVPSDFDKVVALDVYRAVAKVPGSYEQVYDHMEYVGTIRNSAEAPLAFAFVDARGNVIRELEAGARLSSYDINANGDEEHDARLSRVAYYPEYKDYVTNVPTFVNYEVPMAPGKYVMDIRLADEETTHVTLRRGEDGEAGSRMVDYACEDAPDDSAGVFLFNTIYDGVSSGDVRTQFNSSSFYKKARGTRVNSLANTVYSITSLSFGWERYGKTTSRYNGDGELSFSTLYDTLNPDGSLSGRRYYSGSNEVVLVREEVPAPGYYKDDTEILMLVYDDGMRQEFEVCHDYSRHCDGITVPFEWVMGTRSYLGRCSVCDKTGVDCVCARFGSCTCSNCGTVDYGYYYGSSDASHYDDRCPRLFVSKVDDNGNAVAGARLQLISEQTGEVVDEWVSDGSTHVVQFLDSGAPSVPKYAVDVPFRLHEVSVPSMYGKSDDVSLPLSWNSGDVSVSMVDPLLVADVDWIVRKVDSQYNGGPQGNADWSDFAVELVYYDSPDCSGEPKATATFAGDAAGRVAMGQTPLAGTWPYKVGGKNVMPVGSFTAREVSAPAGYHVNPTTYRMRVDADGSVHRL